MKKVMGYKISYIKPSNIDFSKIIEITKKICG